jgi:hypothetical protein
MTARPVGNGKVTELSAVLLTDLVGIVARCSI